MKPKVLEILTNPEAIAVDQDAASIQGHCARQEGPTQIWTKALADGSTAVALLNLNNHSMTITAVFKDLGLPKRVRARDLWLHKDLGGFNGRFTHVVPSHGSVLIKVAQK
jgi:alpha-galactosidase